jgi:hypothetical protein
MQPQEFQSHNSPWTEMFNAQVDREEAASSHSMPMADAQEELQPTLDALADVYNRDTENGKRF